MTWALPNLMLGALVIVPVWFLIYLFRPPRPRSDCDLTLDLRADRRRALALPENFVSSDAATMPIATTAMMIVQMALISGFTPSRTSE